MKDPRPGQVQILRRQWRESVRISIFMILAIDTAAHAGRLSQARLSASPADGRPPEQPPQHVVQRAPGYAHVVRRRVSACVLGCLSIPRMRVPAAGQSGPYATRQHTPYTRHDTTPPGSCQWRNGLASKSNGLRRSIAVAATAMLLAAAAPAVQITGAWARATVPGQDSGAVYLNITATSPDKLLSAASPDASSAMLHQTTHMGSMSGMSDMDAMPIAAGATLAFAPGGAHIMLTGLAHGLKAGTHIRLDLTFVHAGTLHVSVPVQPITAAGPPG